MLREQDFVPGNVIVQRIMTRVVKHVNKKGKQSALFDIDKREKIEYEYVEDARFMIISCVKQFTRRHNKHKVNTGRWEVFLMPLGCKTTAPVKMSFLYGRRSDSAVNYDYQRLNIYASKR